MDDFSQAEAEQGSRPMDVDAPGLPGRELRRSTVDHMIAGVCAGIADFFNLDPTLVRLAFALLLMPGGLPGFLIYLVLWIVMPDDQGRRASLPVIILVLFVVLPLICTVFFFFAATLAAMTGAIFS